jgi:hypothetical protein
MGMQKVQALSLALRELARDQIIRVGAWVDGAVATCRRPQLRLISAGLGEGENEAWGDEVHYHGCNPYKTQNILNEGFLPTLGKGHERYGSGVYTSKFYYTAYQYPMCIGSPSEWYGVSVCPGGPKVRIVLKCRTNHGRILHNWSGTNNKRGRKTNNQQLYPPDAVMVTEVIIHCMEPSPLRAETPTMFRPLELASPIKYDRMKRKAGELLQSLSAEMFPDQLPLDSPFIPPVAQPRPTKKSRGSNELEGLD